MSYDTWIMMVIVLIVNWGGFVAMLAYGIRQEARKERLESLSRRDHY
ncbi:MAG: hypothetical protein VX992_05885 [Acidobacteriota bacterium]|nr:hypothetical protein [Acidobacteriota bacterium]|tara:strand:+ start:855 stop:995 length:141 start_codon:yes stop_codon:yes gene_type:complete